MDLQKLANDQQNRDGVTAFTKDEVEKFMNDFRAFCEKNSQMNSNDSNDSTPTHPLLLKKRMMKRAMISPLDNTMSLMKGRMPSNRSEYKQRFSDLIN